MTEKYKIEDAMAQTIKSFKSDETREFMNSTILTN